MWPYFAFMSVPAALGLSGKARPTAFAQAVVFALYVFFVGWRYQVGPDCGAIYTSIDRS